MKTSNILIFILLLLSFTFARKREIVATDLPAIESLLMDLTANTPLSVIKAIPDNVSIKEERSFFKENESFTDSIAAITDAIFDIRSIWPKESIYNDLRIKNVRIVEVDLANPFDPRITGISISKNNSLVNPYAWLGVNNILKMCEIAYKNLVQLYPKYEKTLTLNLINTKKKYFDLRALYEEKLSKLSSFSVISMSRDFDYLFSDLNIFVESYFPADYSAWSDEQKNKFKNILAGGTKTIILRWKPFEDEFSSICDSIGADFVLPKIGELRVDGMKNGLFEFTKHNIDIIYKSLKRQETGE